MLRPAPMAKLTLISSNAGMRPIIEQLHRLHVAHLVEFSEGAQPELKDFRIGKPLPDGQKASERLVRLRGLQRHLELEGHEPATRHEAADIEAKLDGMLHTLELNVSGVAEAKQRHQAHLDGLEKEEQLLQPLAKLPLKVDDYAGYQSLAVFVGRSPAPVAPALEGFREAELFESEGVFALFVPKAQQQRVAEALSKAGAVLTEAPKGKGTVPERIEAIGRERQQFQQRAKESADEMGRLRERNADWLVAAEEHLSIQAEKAEAPLSFATTEHAFVVECWVPADRVEDVRRALASAVGDNLHVEVTAPPAHGHEPHAAPAQSEEAAHGDALDTHHEEDVPPTAFRLAKPFRPFQMFTEMVSVPRYDEIDPTTVLALVLPIFLGFMIGDAGYGVLMFVLGVYLVTKLGAKAPEARDVGIALAAAGVVSLLFGAVIFADAFGIPVFAHEAAPTCAAFIKEHGETTWTCMLTGKMVVQHPIISKLSDIGDLLVLSVIAAFVHMGLGLGFGIVNSVSHKNWKHVVGKLGWVVLMVGFFTQIMYMAGPSFGAGNGNRFANAVYGGLGLPTILIPVIGVQFHAFLLFGMILAAILLAAGEGPITVLELPTMLSNLMSYTRLAGLAIAKGAMAAAFTSLTLIAMAYGGLDMASGGNALGFVLVLIGLVLFVLTQAFVFVLGVFSSAIQAIRLNYVEFFQKFYQGGGVAFAPFGKKRKYTKEA